MLSVRVHIKVVLVSITVRSPEEIKRWEKETSKLSEEIVDRQEGKWIYESPDGGKTIFRRPFSNYDMKNKVSSMARTTGYTCTAVADILLSQSFIHKGVYNLETLGSDNKIVENILQFLQKRNVQFDKEL